jgi:hypothetical protein
MNLTSQGMDTSYAIQSYSTSSTQVTYFNLQDAQRVLTAMDSSVDWSTLISNPLTDAVIAGAIAKAFTKSNFYTVAATALSWSASNLMARQTEWWEDSVYLITARQITGVKLSVTPNPTGGYPVAYITLERYKDGWILNNGNWYFYNSSGVKVTGWKYDGGKWYYLYPSRM